MIVTFLKRITVSLIIGFIFIFIISKFVSLADNVWGALIAATACALIYVVSGYFSFYFAFSRNQQFFVRVFVFSLAVRFILALLMIVVVLKFTNVDNASFIVLFFVWYFIFQILEVLSLKNIARKKA